MKIALIATEKLPVPAVKGGAIQIYLDAVGQIIAQKHDVTIFSITHPELAETEKTNGVTYVRFPEPQYIESITQYIKEHKFDVIHVCNRPLWIEPLHEASPNTKFILSVHNEMFANEKISEEKGATCISLVSKIVTVSDYIGSTIKNRFPQASNKVQTVYSGVNVHQFYPAWTQKGREMKRQVRSKLGLEGKKVILFVGRLSKVKGPHILLQALPNIISKHPNAVMVFIGSKWFGENEINNYVKHLYTLGALYPEHVQFINFVKPDEIASLFAMSDLFVCSSQWQEPLARVHYEAMACGLPIITSKRGGNPEVIEEGKNGYVIDDFENPEAYAMVINTLLGQSNQLELMGKYGRQKVEQSFQWNHVAANLMRVYEN
ncbi:glycosyltransferase family 4 protein [Bacillus alveayuensis]|jgi:spore coat protein SA|uniref:Spore coat protein SA n=1 Tax=Aeribacillus alveayuensis TaxID=279215 RepID=A0ABT9VNC1_9BACI|nr:glycosyltransferase family 4 protein [Bacillus alveayuensis]MDQ0162472.1 spore coat protein SA [Bacillus alveayuensis]